MLKLKEIFSEERGNAVVIAVLVICAIFTAGGFAVDSAYLSKTKAEMRRIADSAAISGAQCLYTKTSESEFVNDANNAIDKVIPDNIKTKWNITKNVMPDENKVTVAIDYNVPTLFMKIFKNNSVHLAVTSSAVRDVDVTKLSGLRPLGVNKNCEPLSVGTKYKIKDDQKVGDKGWFGFIDLSGTGKDGDANTLKDFMKNGAPYMKEINKFVGIASGNKTSIINDLYDNKIFEMTVPILIYEYIDTADKKECMRITGFALVKITYTLKNKYPKSASETEIFGEFVKTYDFEGSSGLPEEYKVYSTRLVNNN